MVLKSIKQINKTHEENKKYFSLYKKTKQKKHTEPVLVALPTIHIVL